MEVIFSSQIFLPTQLWATSIINTSIIIITIVWYWSCPKSSSYQHWLFSLSFLNLPNNKPLMPFYGQTVFKVFESSFRLYILSILRCLRLCTINYIFFPELLCLFQMVHQFHAINANWFLVLNSNRVYIIGCVHASKVVQECGGREAILYCLLL